ncbi:MAG: hypothetical protein IJ745_06180 [Bacteroidales bacterium]|nr:hypothetical protein [Bacteroidales bacterium]
MKKMLYVFAAVAALGMTTSCQAQGEQLRLSDDKDTLYVTDRDLELAVPKQGDGFYAVETTFVQNDTTFLYREYDFDSIETMRFLRASYFIVPHNAPDFQEQLRRVTLRWEKEKYADYYTAMSEEQREFGSPLVHDDLGDMPRIWYNVMKYDGRYYITCDYPWTSELSDTAYVFHGMELGIYALRNVRRVGVGFHYEYEEHYFIHGWCSVDLTPVRDVTGLWQCAVNIDGNIKKGYMTTLEEASNFDLIDSRSVGEPFGLSRYEIIAQ